MIYEYALEPNLVAKWYDWWSYQVYDEKFSVKTRRVVSMYPTDWRDKVLRAFEKDLSANDLDYKKLEVILCDILGDAIQRPDTFNKYTDWLQRTEKENEQRPFRAIIAEKNPRSNNSVIQSEELKSNKLTSEKYNLWKVPDLKPTPRTTEGISEAAKTILQFCKSVVFIEPYFSHTNKDTQILFRKLFEYVWHRPAGKGPTFVELHTKLKNDATSDQCDNFIKNCAPILEKILPAKKKLKLKVKKDRPHQQRFHNRYILTNSIGICLPHGHTHLDRKQETDDLLLLSRTQLNERWNDHVNGDPSPFELLGEMTIFGS